MLRCNHGAWTGAGEAMRGARRRRFVLGVAACVAALTTPRPPMAATQDGRAQFISDHRCGIIVRLHMIHSQPGAPNRFLAIHPARDPGAYVQCLLSEEDTEILCEAASGFYSVPDGETPPPVPPERVAVMVAAGFSTDTSDGNFQKLMAVTDPARDFETVADLLLGILHDAFGARPGALLRYDAPLAPLESPGMAGARAFRAGRSE